MEVIPIAQIVEAKRKIQLVNFIVVLASPATIGMKALTDGMSLPKKIHHIPRCVKVS